MSHTLISRINVVFTCIHCVTKFVKMQLYSLQMVYIILYYFFSAYYSCLRRKHSVKRTLINVLATLAFIFYGQNNLHYFMLAFFSLFKRRRVLAGKKKKEKTLTTHITNKGKCKRMYCIHYNPIFIL